MNAENAAGRALTGRNGADLGKLLPQLRGVLKVFSLFAVAILTILVALPKSRIDLAAADGDELLLRLAALGSGGAAILCNPERIENYLSIRIDKKRLDGAGATILPVAVSALSQSISGSYWKFQVNAETVCKLQLQIIGRRFCDMDSARIQRLVGRRVQLQLPVPGEASFYDHGYELARDSREWSVMAWREPGWACPANVEIAAAIR